ncbi:putative peptidase M41 [Helianthus annuus]|nr:putative peptidase M41 [Helianthus annuus]KAJ0746680.1 putative peptidase M41 [Helianthus annuus]
MLGCGNWTGMALFFVRSVKQQLQVTRFTSAPFVCKRNGWVPKKVEILVWHASLNHILTRCTLARRNISVSSEFCPMMDSEHKSAVISDDVHKLTAYHESGHTPCLFILMGAHTVHKATTVPHAMVFVVVTQLCKKDETRVSRKESLLGSMYVWVAELQKS